MAKPSGSDRSSTLPDQEIIDSVAFEPVGETGAGGGWRPRPLIVLVAAVLVITCLALLYLISARSLYVRTNAEAPQIAVDGLLTFKVRDHFLLLPGSHRIRVNAAGFEPGALDYHVSDEGTQYVDVNLIPLPGHLTVNTNTPASITIDGRPAGQSGERLTSIARGERNLRLEAPRYQTLQHSIFIEGKDIHQQLELSLLPNWANVTITSQPEGALLSDNGVELGETPLTAQLLAGKHQLTLNLPGYKTWKFIQRVEPQQQLTLPKVQLEAADAFVNISSSPSGAGITLNGQFLGTTPLKVSVSPDQSQQLTLVLDGYQSLNRTITANSGSEQALNFKLQPTLGEVQISSTQADALLYVDGTLMGRANQTLTLPTREHRIRIGKPGYADYSTTVIPRSGLQQVINARLLTEEQFKWKNIERRIVTSAGQNLLLFRPQDTFTMGASRREQGRRANEAQRTVKLDKAFYMGEKLVTNAEFRRFERFHSSGHVKGNSLNGEQQPVVNIRWIQAARYCNWLSKQENLDAVYRFEGEKLSSVNAEANGYRLPTEAEWAWAARLRDGAMLKYGWGDELPPPERAGNFGDRSAAALLGNILPTYDDGFAVTSAPGSFPPNHRQLYDLSGNAAEWMHDYYGITTGLSLRVEENPSGPESGDFHVIRGSSWAHATMVDLRMSFRDYGSDGRYDVGFRLVRNVEL